MVVPFLTRGQVRVHYGDPIDLSRFYGQRPRGKLLEEVTELMMCRLAELGGVDRGTSAQSDVEIGDESLRGAVAAVRTSVTQVAGT